MRDVFAIDVGSGTQDILITDEKLSGIKAKMVLPAPTQLFAIKIRNSKKDVFCDGYIMGGGAITGALMRHAERYRVVMTEYAAHTVRDDLEQVRARGINIGTESDMKGNYLKLTLRDVDMEAFRSSLEGLNYRLPRPDNLVVAVAVQDTASHLKVSATGYSGSSRSAIRSKKAPHSGISYSQGRCPCTRVSARSSNPSTTKALSISSSWIQR